MKAKLTEKYIGEYGSYKVEAGTDIEIVSFPPKVCRAKGTKPFFVHGKTLGSNPLHVHVPFSQTTLNYAKCRRENKDLFLGINQHTHTPQSATAHPQPQKQNKNMKNYTFKNGDIWTEEKFIEGESTYYVAQDKLGNLYETLEEPTFIIDMTGAPSSWEPPRK